MLILKKTKAVDSSWREQTSSRIAQIILGDFEVTSFPSTNCLSIIIDSRLNFHHHIYMVLKKLNQVIFLLRRLGFFLNKNTSGCFISMFFLELSKRVSTWESEKSVANIDCEAKFWLFEFARFLRQHISCRGVFKGNNLLAFPWIFDSLVFL